MYKLCIVGLGNPGKKYDSTRHNIGKDWLVRLSKSYNIDFISKLKFEAEIGESHSGSILWIIPTNYVNNSGRTLSKIIKSTNLQPENCLIMHDELDLDIGSLRIKDSGGHGGHNGLRDITNKIGSANFLRLRIGIGHPGTKDEVTSWVLNKFTRNEIKHLAQSYSRFADVFELITSNNIKEAQKLLHTK